MKKHLSLGASALLALAAIGSLGAAAGDPAVRVFKSMTNSADQSQPAKPNKTAPGDTKTNRLKTGVVVRRKAPLGKRLSQSVAQNRRSAQKARNVKRK